MKKIGLITLLFLSFSAVKAQNESGKWSFGGGISVIDFSGPQTKQYFNFKKYRGNQRYFVGRYINPSFNLKADFTFGKVWFPEVAAYPNVVKDMYENRHIYDFGVNLEYKLNNGYILKEKAIVAPYLFTGLGFNNIIDYGKAKGTDINTYIPFGLGLTVRATNWLSFNLQSSYKLNLDNSFDYTQHSASAVFNFGGKAKSVKVEEVSTEVIDSDKDGVADLVDECPFAAGTESMFGCPDTDADGIGDSRDDCPTVAGSLINKGCPEKDSDGDGIADDKDSCPNEKGEARYAGCPDTDGDGIVNKYDKCPEVAGVASNNGCPYEAPKSETIIAPTTPVTSPIAPTAPKVTTTTTTSTYANTVSTLNTNMGNLVEKTIIFFGSASDVVPTSEKAKIAKVLEILKANPSYRALIKGYTDPKGDNYSNVDLSLKRATTVWQYMNNNGMNGEQADVFGYGEYVQEANTDQGNRRVVIEIVK